MRDFHPEAMDALLEHGRFPRDDEKTLTSFVAAAIKKAVEEEREACAALVEADRARFPNDEQRYLARQIRARGEA